MVENILLAATNEGLGCAVHVPVGKETGAFAAIVGAPAEYTLPVVIAVGYPAKDAQVPTQVSATIEEKVHWNKW